MTPLNHALDHCPFIAILRGLTPPEAPDVGAILYEEGFRLIQVPLNFPDALDSIRVLVTNLPKDAIVGAGNVLNADDVDRAADAGCRLIVAPNLDLRVIARAIACGLWVLPGVATPTEAFRALDAGAHGLKMFPGEALPPPVLKAWRAVLPRDALLLPVGGVTPQSVPAWRAAGADGFGLGSALYTSGRSAFDVGERAADFVRTLQTL